MNTIDIHRTFWPGHYIVDPDYFAGRKDQIERALRALLRPGENIFVYGDRGVGKSSFVEIVKLIAAGYVEIIYRHGLHSQYPTKELRFKSIKIDCDDSMNCTAKVLQRIITSPEGIKGIIAARKEKVETIVKDSMTLNFMKSVIDYGFSEEEKTTYEELREDSVFEIFSNLIKAISKNLSSEYSGLLVIIDEFDRVEDTKGMASLIKTLGSGNVKFIISGISKSISGLIHDHKSITRQSGFGKIGLDPMKDEEIEDIFFLISFKTKNQLSFDKFFIEEVKSLSGGYPYFVQFFGQLALDAYVKHYSIDKPAKLTKDILYRGFEYFIKAEPEMEDLYHRLIGIDPRRELVLKSFAIQIPDKILQNNAFRYCIARGIPQPKKSLTTLLSLSQSTIVRVGKHYIRFRDPLFKVYCKIREPILIRKDGTNYLLT